MGHKTEKWNQWDFGPTIWVIVLHTKYFLLVQDSRDLEGSLGRVELKILIKGNLEMCLCC